MSTVLLLLVSAALIGAGVGLVWRDLHAAGRRTVAVSPDGQSRSDANAGYEAAKIAAPPAGDDTPILRGKLGSPLSRGRTDQFELPRADGQAAAATAQQWTALRPVIGAAVEQVNAVLAQAGVAIGPPDDPSWGAGNAYGSNRLIDASGRNLARLRLECTPGGRLKASVASLDGRLADEIGGEAAALAADATVGSVSDLLSECLKPATAYALRNAAEAQRATESDWRTVEATVGAAMKVANGAIVEAGARLVPIGPPVWDAAQGLHRLPVSVQMFGRDIARMHIDRLGREMEVAVGLPDARLATLGRRQRLAVDGMTAHALAEMIAACAWPAIAHDRETRRSA